MTSWYATPCVLRSTLRLSGFPVFAFGGAAVAGTGAECFGSLDVVIGRHDARMIVLALAMEDGRPESGRQAMEAEAAVLPYPGVRLSPHVLEGDSVYEMKPPVDELRGRVHFAALSLENLVRREVGEDRLTVDGFDFDPLIDG